MKSINAVGSIDVSAENPTIQMDVALNEFNMQAFSPFGGDVITDIRGLITGNAKVSGNYKSPNIDGSFNLEDSGLKVPYLNVDFDLENNAEVLVTKNKIAVSAITITDTKYNTKGTFIGSATHRNFGDWKLDMDISSNNLLVLDTPPDEDALYYGCLLYTSPSPRDS